MALIVTDATFEKEVLQDSKYVLVDFWAEWCGPCRMLAPVIEKVGKTFESTLKICKVDTDANPVVSQQYQISSIPCCILFKNGKEVDRLIGFRAEAQFTADIKRLTEA